MYLYQQKKWPAFHWDDATIYPLLAHVRFQQGILLGKMSSLGFQFQEEASLQMLTQDVLKSSEIEGEILDAEQVRSSIARRLKMDIAGMVPADRNVDGVVEMMLDATQRSTFPLTKKRLFGWHNSLFPTGHSGMYKIVVGAWRDNAKDDPMQVISGTMGRETVHFQAPDSAVLEKEMNAFLKWFNTDQGMDLVLKAAIAHLWFVTIHPFDDGNGRIGRAITDMLLARSDQMPQRFYSMSTQIRVERKAYYHMLEETQKSRLDITDWLCWFFKCLNKTIVASDAMLNATMRKATFWASPAALDLNDRQKLMLNKLLDGFTGKLTSSKWAVIAKCSQDTAVRDIQELITSGVLVKEAAGGRSTSYILQPEQA